MKKIIRKRFIKYIILIAASFFFVLTVNALDTLAHWGFNEGSGNSTNEDITNTEFTINSNWRTVEWVPGVKQNAMRTDGYSVWAQGTLPGNLPTTAITICAWVAPEVYPVTNSAIWAQFDDAAKSGAWMGMDKYGRLLVEFSKDGSDLSYTSLTSFNHYKWNYIVVNINAQAGTINGYINAVKVIDQTFAAGSIIWPTSKTTLIGKYPSTAMNGLYNTNTMNAIIDEVTLLKTPLDQATITQNYTQGNPLEDPSMKTPASRFAGDFLRPQYHPIPNNNWCNESHGLIYYNGMYHLFYQKNGNGGYLFQQNWGHLESPDLVSWQEVVPALWPLPGWDNYGIWSGHCVFDATNTPTIFYTGVDGVKAGIGSATPGSTNLLTWQKNAGNPLIPAAPTAVPNLDFRDPYLFKEGSTWYMITGSGLQSPAVGAVFLYQSTDLQTWTYVGPMYQGNNAQYASGIFWEMPVFWKFGSKYMLLVDKTPETNNPARDFYWVGDFNGTTFTPDNTSATNLELINWLLSPSVNTDKDGIVTAIGIIPDLIPSSEQYKRGYANVFSLAREWDMVNNKLIQKPHLALQKLRADSIFFNNITVTPTGSNFLNGTSGFQKEIRASITAGASTQKAGIIIEKNTDGSEYTSIYYDYYYGELSIDRTHSSTNPNTQGDLKTVSFTPDDPSAPMDWHIYIDGSVVEVFINDKYAFASRIYPTSANSNGIDLFTTGAAATANVTVYNINPNSVLPVTWLSFTAQQKNSAIQLQWQTAAEINNDHFEVQKSTDGVTFNSIASLAANNDSRYTATYNFSDYSPVTGKNYYRIKQVDKDGKISYSNIRQLNYLVESKQTRTKIIENPVAGSIELLYNCNTDHSDISLYDASSKRILNLKKSSVLQNEKITIPINSLTSGVFYLRVSGDNFIESHEVVIEK
jgi:sucrose-6-phosphate hydrolase SacC (GH32 family)